MAKLLTRQLDESQSQPEPCNFSASTENVMVEQQVPIEELKQRCTNYLNYLNSLQPAQGNIMVRASSFTTDSVLQMINSSPGSTFIRVYYGIDATGRHLFFMGPVTGSSALTTTEEPVYVDECCACPPLGNCEDDELINPA